MISGRVYNHSMGTKRDIRVEARVLDNRREVVARQEQPCGHIFSPSNIQKMSDAEINARYESLSNDDRPLRPGKTLDCAVIFLEPPAGYSAVTHSVEMVVTSADVVIENSP
jgi:hypothetical protein